MGNAKFLGAKKNVLWEMGDLQMAKNKNNLEKKTK